MADTFYGMSTELYRALARQAALEHAHRRAGGGHDIYSLSHLVCMQFNLLVDSRWKARDDPEC